MSTTERRFTIRWVRPSNGGVGEYKVSIPNYDGDETLHKALDSIGWPADYVESGRE
jgi:hypothetical protein